MSETNMTSMDAIEPNSNSLKEALCIQQRLLQKLYNELDVERESAAIAASEALSMILRLQGEKAAVKMEAEQYKRLAEEKMNHAEESMEVFEEIMYQKEMEIAALDYQVQAYRYKLSSLGYDDLGVNDVRFPETLLQRTESLVGETSCDAITKKNNTPPRRLKLPNLKKGLMDKDRSIAEDSDMIAKIVEESLRDDENLESEKKPDGCSSSMNINSYLENLRKLDKLVEDVSGGELNICATGRTSRCSSIHSKLNELDLPQSLQKAKDEKISSATCLPSLHDVFEVPQIDETLDGLEKKPKNMGKSSIFTFPESVKSYDHKDEVFSRKKTLPPKPKDKKIFLSGNGIDVGYHMALVRPTTTTAKATSTSQEINKASEIIEGTETEHVEKNVRQGPVNTMEAQQLRLLYEIRNKLNSIQSEIRGGKKMIKKPSPNYDLPMLQIREGMSNLRINLSIWNMASSSQSTLQQQLAAAQEQIQWLNEQNLQMNGELSILRASNPQTSHVPPQVSQPFIQPQVSQVSLPPPPPVNNPRPIFPPLPSGPYPGATTFTYNQPQTGPRPFIPIPEPISHVPTAATPITHIPNLSNVSGTSSNPPHNDIVDIRLKMLEEQNKAMLALLTKLPGAAVPIEVEPKTGFQASPYIDEIALVDIPKKYNIPAFTPKYSGISDPVEHIAQYKQLVWTVPIPTQFQEICMCKGFGSTLTGAALQWLINLKPKSIASWSELVNQFTRQFASSRKMEKQTSDLYYVVQKTGETIREYFNRFNAEMIEVKNCDVRTAIEAYKRGLDTSSELYTDLTKYPPENFDDVRARTLAHMRIEDDAIFRRKHSNDKKNLGAQKHDFKPKRVNKIDNSRRDQNKHSNQGKGKVRYPDLSTYHFAGTTKDLVDSLRNLEVNVRWPKKPENPSKDKDQTKWCDFHSDHVHNTDDCISLKKEIAYLKSNGHLKNLLGDDSKRPTSPVPTKVVNCITGGSEVCGLTYSAAKRHAREGPEGHPIPNESRTAEEKELDATKISFDIEDMSDAHQKHHDALVIQLTIGNCLTKRVLIDGGSSANVIFAETLKIMGIDRSNIVRRTTTLIGFNGDATSTLGEIILPVFAKGINKQTKFNVIDCPSAYNAILGRPWIHDMKAVPSTYHQKIKFPSPWGVQEIEHSDCFAWSHEDMVGIDPNIISHKLNVDPTFKPVKQKRRKFAPERNKYPDWLANVVVVQKKNGKWRVCIDFTDLNKACPKDPFPLPHIDATAGHELLTFMDANSGYNQILMHKDDQEKTAFMTDKGIYCYKVMPFGLKNAGSTYQRLVNRMFKDHLGRTMEVYIDDMLVKSERSQDHIQHLKQSFDILREYKMKLNPTKCSFGVRAGKFLEYMVTRRGIEASPEQIKAILEIQSPRNVKEVQKLTGRVAALNRFISRSSDKCHLFYNVLRKNKGFDWTEAHEEALQSLKKYMSNPPLLTKPIEGESLQLYLAVSNNAVSAVLVREGDQHQQPIYYISKSFLDAETRYTSMEKLLLGLVTAAKKLRHYFESHHIIVVTNYPLKIVLRKPELTGRLAKWSIYLSSFDLTYQPRTAIKSQALADFVAEFSPGIEEPSYDEISNVMIHDNEPWTMHVDGASNARGSGLGVVLKSSHGGNMVYSVRCEFKTTNNEAEYEALIAGLDMAYNLGARWLHVRSDSLLVVNQINSEFQAKDSKMISYLKIAKDKIA
ncbi:hypothetical protein OSB04_012495 [Centaurea solstitialis]|uniref:RNase H type-1 domain-containing protein n=1 Tax=Centaurea solstitialis TaxID=347529 RepID=A0AA38TPH6_9ASTR|nr:hypothetical protein OSB04_012495 [Centaurea solstitialis]